jgi:hypothetical protein
MFLFVFFVSLGLLVAFEGTVAQKNWGKKPMVRAGNVLFHISCHFYSD